MTSLPTRLSTNYMTLIPSKTYIELLVVSMEHLQRVWHASRKRWPSRTLGSFILFRTCLCSNCWDHFPELAVSFLGFSPWISLGTLPILLSILIQGKHRILDMTRNMCKMANHIWRIHKMQHYFNTRGICETKISRLQRSPLKEKKEEIWLSPVTKTPTPTEQSTKQRDNTKTPPKTLITQLLRTDLGRSVGVTAVTQLVWLNRSTSAQPSH